MDGYSQFDIEPGLSSSGNMEKELIAPCGMNCALCISYFGYTMTGKERKKGSCPGCRPRDKGCSFLMKYCDNLSKKSIEFCYECEDFPCDYLKKLDDNYKEKYDMSMIENLNSIQHNGMEYFLEKQQERYTCPECGKNVCVHTDICYNCYPP